MSLNGIESISVEFLPEDIEVMSDALLYHILLILI